MPPADEKLELLVDGAAYAGWKSVSVTRSLETISGAFSLEVSDRWSGQARPWPIPPGARCEIRIGAETVLTGWVDEMNPSFSSSERSLTVTGRDATGDLVDCSPEISPSEWANLTLPQIVTRIAGDFGVKVAIENGAGMGGRFAKFTLQPGETAFAAISRACRMRAVLPVSDGVGGILLTRGGRKKAGDALVQGENILSASAGYSLKERFSTYIVKGQQAATDQSYGAAAAHVRATAADEGVKRHRPLVIIASGDPDGGGSAQERARWEAIVRAGRSASAEMTVVGWRQSTGELWQPGLLVPVKCPWLGMDSEMVVSSVQHKKSASGTTTALSVTRPDAFTQMAKVPAQKDPWNMLARQVAPDLAAGGAP